MSIQKAIKRLEDEIFSEEEFLWKSQESVSDLESDKGFVNGLRFALRVVKEEAIDDREVLAQDLDDMAYTRMKEE